MPRVDVERERQGVMAQGADEQEGGHHQDGTSQEFRPLAELRAAAEDAVDRQPFRLQVIIGWLPAGAHRAIRKGGRCTLAHGRG